MNLNVINQDAYTNSVGHGFFDTYKKIENLYSSGRIKQSEFIYLQAEFRHHLLSNLHDEVSEVSECIKTNDFSKLGEELADVYIMLGTFCSFMNIDIDGEIKKKMQENINRNYRHMTLY